MVNSPRRKPTTKYSSAGAVYTGFFFTLYCFQKKEKENEARPGCFRLAKRLRHNVLLVPRKTPFGTYSVSFWPTRIPSCKIAFFFFFAFFCFLWKNIFYWDVYRCNYLLTVCLKEIGKFWKDRKSIFTVLKTLLQIGMQLHACTPAFSLTCMRTYLQNCIPAYQHIFKFAFQYSCIPLYLHTCFTLFLKCLYLIMLALA